jgi:DNA-binding NarL/FixJ family response regulator
MRVLIADDDADFGQALAEALGDAGLKAEAVTNRHRVLDLLARDHFDFAVIDVRFGNADGIAMTKELRALRPGLGCVVMTAHGTLRLAVDAMRAGAVDFLEKPFAVPSLLATLDRARGRLELEARASHHELVRRRVEAALADTLQALHTVVEAARAPGAWGARRIATRVVDEVGRLVYADALYCALVGRPLGTMLGLFVNEVTGPSSFVDTGEVRSLLSEGLPARCTALLPLAGRPAAWLELRVFPLYDGERRLRGRCECLRVPDELCPPANEPVEGPLPVERLTPRQRELFVLASRGLLVKQLAGRLGISPNTARNHLQEVYRRLGVRNRTELLTRLARSGGG